MIDNSGIILQDAEIFLRSRCLRENETVSPGHDMNIFVTNSQYLWLPKQGCQHSSKEWEKVLDSPSLADGLLTVSDF